MTRRLHREDAGAVAAQIDRLVLAVHERAGLHQERPALLAELVGHPALLDTAGQVLLQRPIDIHDLRRIVPYTPPQVLTLLLRNNAEAGVIEAGPGKQVTLTARGRPLAAAICAHQRWAAEFLWAGRPAELGRVVRHAARLVQRAGQFPPPLSPAAFSLFPPAAPHPPGPAHALQLVRALRYWRADAHRRAWAEQDLTAVQAHALNHLWDEHRGVQRPGQGVREFAADGFAALDATQLTRDGALTAKGLRLRELIEDATDRYTSPPYEALTAEARIEFLAALTALPG